VTYYLSRAKVSQDAIKALIENPRERISNARNLIEALDGTLHNYFFSFGHYDIVLIYELAENINASAVSMVLTGSGSVSEVETTVLLTMEEAVDAMRRAGVVAAVHRPPSRRVTTE
jgi:uncharacterized protein with GYD domain